MHVRLTKKIDKQYMFDDYIKYNKSITHKKRVSILLKKNQKHFENGLQGR